MAEPASKFKATTAQEICKAFELEPEGLALLRPDVAPVPFLDALVKAGSRPDAVNFLAFGLPKREAVWWACLCVRAAGVPAQGPILKAAAAAERWVYRPSEESRLEAGKCAEAAGTDHPAGWTALAAFWNSGSMVPPDVPPVPPAEDLTAKAVAGAVTLAAVAEPMLIKETYAKFFAAGIEIAGGGTGRKALPDVVTDGQ